MKNISWDDYKIAYQVAVDGSLSQAGKSLNINHATVLRRINQLETALEVKLFFRHQRGYKVTDAGAILIKRLPDLIARFSQLEHQLQNVESNISGELRISTISSYSSQLAPALKAFRDIYPAIRIMVLSTDDIVPLESGAAHVSLRAGPKPNGADLIVKELTRFKTNYYACADYVNEFGKPTTADTLNNHSWVLPTPDKYRIPFVRYIVDNIDKDRIVFQSNHFPDVNQAVIEGMGIGPMGEHQAKLYPSLVEIPLNVPKSEEAMWFVYHKDSKHSARVKCFYAFLIERLNRLAALEVK
ncbi:LysR family transcriptional regulator [Moritella sp. 24]|uniref:LysR family transcriptional regulator n=1 Tax=Moritella sp. 24 TaxID=2746230 RepID=UPI001BAC4B12|nr:LysR family transcriptional regulator [Moritella sp. 24]QUM76836.1 LysR family transcriptional regulator [Moritella sp. 24]